MDELEQQLDGIQQEMGGGGIVAKVRVEAGYKVFAPGVQQDDAWFSFAPGDEAGKAVAQAQANKLSGETGARVQFGVNIVVPTADAYSRGEPATWSVPSRHFFEAYWQESCKQVVMPGLKANGIGKLPWNGWARLGFKPDPFGTTELDQNGEERPRRVAYVSQTFADEGAALAALGTAAAEQEPIPGFDEPAAEPAGKTVEGLPIPGQWKAISEDEFRKEMVKCLTQGITPEETAKALGEITPSQVGEWARFYRGIVETAEHAPALAAATLKTTVDVVTMWRALL